MRRVGLIPLSVFILAAAVPARAQVQLGGEVGLAHVRETGVPESLARMLSANLDALGAHGWFRGSGLTTFGTEGQWTGQALGAVSLFGPINPQFQWEMSGVTTTFAQTARQTAYSAEILARLHASRATFGGAAGFGVGVRRADGGQQPVTRGQLTGWATVRENRFTGEMSAVRTKTERPSTFDGSISFSYVDLSAGWRRDLGIFSFGATAGTRATNTAILAEGMSGSLEAVAWITPFLAVVGAAGRSMDDVVRGIPPTRYVSGSVRLTSLAHALTRSHKPPTGPHVIAGRERVEIRADGATRVELMADFTDWNPVELTRAGTVWLLERAITPGLHRIALRLDGGQWITPGNLPRASDDLGGYVGLVTIP